jgi:hypothetical protein
METLNLDGFAGSLLLLAALFLAINALFITRIVTGILRAAVSKRMLWTHALLFLAWLSARIVLPAQWGDGELFVTAGMLASIHLFVLALQVEWSMHRQKMSSNHFTL